jgi:hypothetical protein
LEPASLDSPSRWYITIVAAGGIGLVVGFFSVAMQMHHDLHWPGMLACAPVDVLGRIVLGTGEAYLYFKIIGTAPLYALYAYIWINPQLKGWRPIVLGIHFACAIGLMAMHFMHR